MADIETVLQRAGGSCECKAGFGQADAAKLPLAGTMILSPDFQLVMNGMMDNGVNEHANSPDKTIRELAAHIETTPVEWLGGKITVSPEGVVPASRVTNHEMASRLAVCINRMQNGGCAIYKLEARQ